MDTSQIKSKIAQHKRWYHRIELAPGIVTPGTNASRQNLRLLDDLGLPASLTGKRVLDIGCRDGFFCFEMERRGAQVVGIDTIPKDETGFSIAAQILGSTAEFHTDDVYNLSPEEYGSFDLVLFLGVIYHLRHPMIALERIRDLTLPGGMMLLESQSAIDSRIRQLEGPAWEYFPFNALRGDETNKWVPNLPGVCGTVEDCGFTVDQKAEHGERVFLRASRDPEVDFRLGEYFDRQVESITGVEVRDSDPVWGPVAYARSLRVILDARDRELESVYAVLKKANESVEPLEKLVAAREAQITAQNNEIDSQRQVIDARTAQIESLKGTLHERERQIESLEPVLVARHEELESIKPVLAARQEELESIKPVLVARDEELAALRPTLAAREEELASVKATLVDRDHELEGIKATFLGKTLMRLRRLKRKLSGREPAA